MLNITKMQVKTLWLLMSFYRDHKDFPLNSPLLEWQQVTYTATGRGAGEEMEGIHHQRKKTYFEVCAFFPRHLIQDLNH